MLWLPNTQYLLQLSDIKSMADHSPGHAPPLCSPRNQLQKPAFAGVPWVPLGWGKQKRRSAALAIRMLSRDLGGWSKDWEKIISLHREELWSANNLYIYIPSHEVLIGWKRFPVYNDNPQVLKQSTEVFLWVFQLARVMAETPRCGERPAGWLSAPSKRQRLRTLKTPGPNPDKTNTENRTSATETKTPARTKHKKI